MYDVHLGPHGKRVVDFLLVLIELFSLDVTAEALRAKIDRKSLFRSNAVTLTQNFKYVCMYVCILFVKEQYNRGSVKIAVDRTVRQ